MLNELKKDYTLVRILMLLLIIALGVHVFTLVWQVIGNFSDIIIMLIFAWLLSFILEPLTDRIEEKFKISKVLSALFTYLLVTLIIILFFWLFVPTVILQIQSLTKIIPGYLESAPEFANNWGNKVSSQLANLITLIPSIANLLFQLFIILIFSFYFVVEKDHISEEIFTYAPPNWHTRIKFAQRVVNETFASFLRLQLFYGILTGITTWLTLWVLKIDFAASTSFLAGLIGLIPLLGAPLSLIPPVFVALISGPTHAVVVGIVLLLSQQVLFNIIGPKVISGAFKLHPAVVLISFLIGLKVAGTIGAFFAVPVLGISAVAVREISRYLLTSKK